MSSRSSLFTLALVAGAIFSQPLVAAQESQFSLEQQPERAYDLMSRQLFTDAVDELEEYHKNHQATRETRFALASCRVNYQPVTEQRIQQAYNSLEELYKEDATDDVGVRARYVQARIEQVHRGQPNYPAALKLYREIYTAQPEHPWAQRALSRIILLEMYSFDPQDPQNEEARKLLAEFATQAAALTDPLAIRMAEITLAEAIFYFGFDKAQGLAHVERALAAGIVRERLKGDVLLMAATTADEIGQKDKALAYYQEFVAHNQRDNRRPTVERIILAMGGEIPKPALAVDLEDEETTAIEPAAPETSPTPAPESTNPSPLAPMAPAEMEMDLLSPESN